MSFQDIKGNEAVVHFFKRELELNRVGSAYLFFGPDGVGKTFLAVTLSKALNCLQMHADSCDNCVSCAKIDNRNHPDVIFVECKDEKESIGIGAIRQLQERMSLKPYEGRNKVFIIQDSNLMTEEAANCLLKTLEEPAKNSVIILITSKTEELLPTVRSRCKQIKFMPLGLNDRVELAKRQGFLKEDALLLSRLVDGGASFSLDYKNRVLDEFNSKENLLDEKSFIFSGSKKEMRFAILIIGSWFRDILILKSGGEASFIINSDRMEELMNLRDKFSFEELETILEDIGKTQFYIDRNVGPKLALNTLKIKVSERKKPGEQYNRS